MTGSSKPDLKVVDENFDVPENVPDNGPDVLEKPKQPNQFWYGAQEFAALNEVREYLVEGWLLTHGITALLAKRGTGKSTIALDLACHVSRDLDWLGIPTQRDWKVIYLCLEDDEGMILNLRAWGQHKKRGIPDSSRLLVGRGLIKIVGEKVLNRAGIAGGSQP